MFYRRMTMILLLLLFCHVHADTRRLMSRVVTTKYGALRGYITTLPNRHLQPVEVFLGVPYATPPVGSLRFMPPVTPAHWRGVRMADRFGPVCPQKLPDIKNETQALHHMPSGRLEYLRRLVPYLQNQSEDCLYLNIYAPALAGRDPVKVPVMVFIHGESYEWNAGNPYDGSILASFGNVVVVTINYRLGILGFLPAVEGSARGNYGLMDQVAALHWVQENVAEFGGDPRNVTIFGQGHGAAFVNLLMVSPMAKGLFHRAIMQSGSALSPWAIAAEAMTYTRHLARILGCPTQESALLLDCMRQRPLADIMRIQLLVPEHLSAFGPTVDGIVIPNHPLGPMEEYSSLYGQYDLMFGVTRIESYFQFSSHEERHGIDPDRRDRILRTLVRNLYTYHMQEIFLTIVNEYTDWTRPLQHPVNILDSTIDILGDALIVAPLMRGGNYHSRTHSKTFFYVFAYQTEDGDYSQRQGCIHGEDLAYIFGAPLVGGLSHFAKNFTRPELALAEAVMTYWINFAKIGDPNIPPHEVDSAADRMRGRFDRFLWPQYETVHQKYLMIAMKPKVRDHYHAHRLSFWLHLIPQLHRPGTLTIIPQHHLLDDHENPLTYDGIVRQVPLTMTSTEPTDAHLPGVQFPTLPGSFNTSVETEAAQMTTPSIVKHETPARPAPVKNYTDTRSVIVHQSSYSTALSVTIAVGCSLLILNVLIFAGVYYQKDKNRLEAKLQKRNYKVRRPSDKEPPPFAPQTKPSPIGAPSPTLICTREYSGQPPVQGVRVIPPKVPPKPVMVAPPENALPEAQPLLPHSGAQLKNNVQPATQEMPV